MVLQGHDNLHDTLQNIAHRNFYSLFEFFNPLNGCAHPHQLTTSLGFIT